jgi:uncharacterized repeat protein (TIGR01451 family)
MYRLHYRPLLPLCVALGCLISSVAAAQCVTPPMSLAPVSPGAPGGNQNVAVGTSPMRVISGLFNSDAIPDLATSDLGSDTVTVKLGLGDGTFVNASGSPIAMPASGATNGSRPHGLTTADFNRDGRTDIVVSLRNSGKVLVLLGDGIGGFVAQPAVSVTSSYVFGAAAADFNGDQNPDFAMVHEGQHRVYLLSGNGSGGLALQPGWTVQLPEASNPVDVIAGNFMGSAAIDLAVANAGNDTVSILEGQGDGTFVIHPAINVVVDSAAYPIQLEAHDVNGDGVLEILVATLASRPNGGTPGSPSNRVAILQRNGGGIYELQQHVFAGFDLTGVTAADFNFDGVMDLASSNAAWSFSGSIALGSGGAYQAPLNYSAGGNPLDVVVRDLDLNGTPDLVVLNQPSNTLTAYLNGCPTGNLAPVANPDSGPGYETDEDNAFVTANVLGNDSDPNGDTVELVSIDTSSTLGVVTDLGDGSFGYDPAGVFAALRTGESELDSFTYTVTDGNGESSTASVSILVVGIDDPAEISLLSDAPAQIVAGTGFNYTLEIHNAGPDLATGVSVSGPLPSGVNLVSASGCSVNAGALECALDDLDVGQSALVVLEFTAPVDASGSTNFNFALTGDSIDPDGNNNLVNESVDMVRVADLSITLDDPVSTLMYGTSTTYTLVVENSGPSLADGAAVFFPQPSGSSVLGWTCSVQGQGSCTSQGSGELGDSVNLGPGARLTYTIEVLVDEGATESFTASALVVAPIGTTDGTGSNNSAEDTNAMALFFNSFD